MIHKKWMHCILLLLAVGPQAFAQTWLYEDIADMDSTIADSVATDDPGSVPERMDLAPWDAADVGVLGDTALQNAPAIEKKSGIASIDTSEKKDAPTGVADAAQGGLALLQGMVYGSDDSKPLENASVVIRMDSTLLKAETDVNGLFVIRGVKPGVYQVRISRKGFAPLQKEGLSMRAGVKVTEDYAMDKRVAKGKVFEVQKPRASSSTDLMAKRQQSGVVMEGVSAEQIAKSTDSDAGAIAKRVTGTSVVGGKYVYVRGLGERYTNMTLNGLPVPTPEKDKRVVPQDLFPANALESFAIYKTFNADLPADFAGGSVALETKGFPEKDFTKISIGLGATDALGDGKFLDIGDKRLDFKTDNGVADYMGFVSASQEVPDGVPTTVSSFVQKDAQDIAKIAEKWDDNWGVQEKQVLPDLNLGVSTGRLFKKPSYQHGFIANASFKNSYDSEQKKRIKAIVESARDSVWVTRKGLLVRAYGIVNDTLDDGTVQPLRIIKTGLEQDLEVGTYATSLSGLFDWGYQDRNNNLWVKTLYANLSEKNTTYNNSTSAPGVSAGQENVQEERFILDFERRSIMVGQFGGSHYIGRSVLDSVAWAGSVATSSGRQPDSKKYYYIRQDDSTLVWDAKQPWASRQFQEFGENLYALRGDFFLVVPPEWSSDDVLRKKKSWLSFVALPKLRAGFLGSLRDRDFDMNTYSWVDNSIRTTGSDFDLVQTVLHPDSVAERVRKNGAGFRSFLGDYDTYDAQEASLAGYGMLDESAILWGIPTSLVLGGRWEGYSMDFHAPFTSEVTLENPALREDSAINIQVRELQFYPSASLTFDFIPKTKTRFIYAGTIVRPEMRERTPTLFFDTEDEIEVEGNPDLRNTEIQHFDCRLEWYLPRQQLLSLSLFYKDFKDPIELVIDGNLSPSRKYFQNAKGAYVRGLEIEADIGPGNWFAGSSTFWKGFGLYGNAAWIASEVEIDTTLSSTSLLTSKKRPMIGQSPYVYNAKLTHDYEFSNAHKLMNGLLYNITGRRIRALGVSYVPDTYEEPFAALDYMAKYSFGKHAWGLKIKNLLNSEQRYTVTEYNDKLQYHTVADEDRDRIYAANGAKRTHVISSSHPGIAWSVAYDYQF